jgi:hypothetical protein
MIIIKKMMKKMMTRALNLALIFMASIDLERLLLKKMSRSFELLSRTTDYPGLKPNRLLLAEIQQILKD